jgi:hypothetical protein
MNDVTNEAPLQFESDIKPLFRERDRDAMLRFHFDLWSAGDVRGHSAAVVRRLRQGTMPCDGAWPPDRIDVLERWLAQGEN